MHHTTESVNYLLVVDKLPVFPFKINLKLKKIAQWKKAETRS